MVIQIAYLLPLLAGAFALNLVIAKIRFNSKYKLPNEVPGWPIIGNMFDPFPTGMWGVGMAKKYGEMFTQNIGNKKLIYLNSSRVVEDLLEKRSTINSRPYRPNLFGIMSTSARIVMMPYSDEWRKQRKIFHSLLNSTQAETKFTPFQDLESKQLVLDLLRNPQRYDRASQRFSNSVILSVTFGRRARKDDELLTYILGYTGVLGIHQFSPFVNPADFFHWLNYLPKPLQWWRKFGDEFNQQHIRMFQKEVDRLNEKIENGTAKPCFAVDFLKSTKIKKEFEMDEVHQLYVLSGLIEAGSDTTRIAIVQMMAAAACYPEWAAKARKLLDEVCGANAERLPTLHDRAALPYMTAVVKEVLRWRPFLQTGVPHVSTEDIEYEGYRIPKGSDFTWNAYHIALDESENKDAVRFEPERFMNEDLHKLAKGHWAFGAGRRVCAGLNVAANNLWIASATVLYCFDIAEDPDHPIDQFNTQWEDPIKPPFKIKMTPRSQAHIDLIERGGRIVEAADY